MSLIAKDERLIIAVFIFIAGFFIGVFIGKDTAISNQIKKTCAARVEIKSQDLLYSELEAKTDYNNCLMYWVKETK